MAAVLECMDGRAIGHEQGRAIVKRHSVGHFEAVECRNRDLFSQPAITTQANHAIANGKAADAITNGFDHASDFAARRKGAFGLELV